MLSLLFLFTSLLLALQALGDTIVVGQDRHVAVWTLAKGQAAKLKQRSFCEHQRPVRRVEVVGRWIITCSGDYVMRLWDSRTGLCVRELEVRAHMMTELLCRC